MKRGRESEECSECSRGGSCFRREVKPTNMSMAVDNSSEVTRRIERVFKEAFMSDVVLIVGGVHYPAHRLLLSASSPVFESMFSRRWMGEHISQVELIENRSCERLFKNFLSYMYNGKVNIDVISVLPVLILADKYAVEELVAVSVFFMNKHIPAAVDNDVFFSWLQYTEAAGHKVLANQCKMFALWNVDVLKNCSDLAHLEPDVLTDLLQQNDLVVESEYKLFEFVVKWLEMRNMTTKYLDMFNGCTTVEDAKAEEELVKSVMQHIRFPMMEPQQLATLHDLPIVLRFKDYFMWRLGVGMSYQGGNQAQADRLVQMMMLGSDKSKIFTPRLYLANVFSLQVEMENINMQPPYVSRTYCFSSRTNMATGSTQREEIITDWVIDFYPRGVYFDKFFVISWQGLLECPERNKQTVRMRLTCQGPQFPLTVKVGICVYRSIGPLEHVTSVMEKILNFDSINDTRNIDDIVDFNELANAVSSHEIVNLKMRLIIMPMDKYCSTDVRKPAVRRAIGQRKIAS